jgi:hypothetical protein
MCGRVLLHRYGINYCFTLATDTRKSSYVSFTLLFVLLQVMAIKPIVFTVAGASAVVRPSTIHSVNIKFGTQTVALSNMCRTETSSQLSADAHAPWCNMEKYKHLWLHLSCYIMTLKIGIPSNLTRWVTEVSQGLSVAGGDESPIAEWSIEASPDAESLADDLQYKSAHFSNSFHSVLTLAADW